MTSEPTNQELLEAIDSLALAIGAVEERLDAKIDSVRDELIGHMRGMEDRLKAEISEAYDLHKGRIKRLEAAVGE